MKKKLLKVLSSTFFLLIGFACAQTLATIAGLIEAKELGLNINQLRPHFSILFCSIFAFLVVNRLAIWSQTLKAKGSWSSRNKRFMFVPLALVAAHIWMGFSLFLHGISSSFILEQEGSIIFLLLSKLIFEYGLGWGGTVWLIFTLAKIMTFQLREKPV